MGEGSEGVTSLEYTPTWVVAAVCTFIVAVSLVVDRLLHYTGKYLMKKNQKHLFEALQKVKEELMVLGFISLLLSVSQNMVVKICVEEDLVRHLLPCPYPATDSSDAGSEVNSHNRHFLSEEIAKEGYCEKKGKVQLVSVEALHHLHILIFVLAVVHVTLSVLTLVFGGLKIRTWKHWEDSIEKENFDPEKVLKSTITNVHEHEFVKGRFQGIGKRSSALGWLLCFLKQFYASVTKSDYLALRLGFITTHCRGNPKFNFHKYMIRALEDDFRKVVGISWYLWVFVMIFLLLNIHGWHTFFWISFIPLILLLAVGTKLEHVISQLAHEVAEKHVAIEGELVVQPSDEHFWFSRPRIVLHFIHFILFQNAFEIAFYFRIWVQYGFNSCIMGHGIYSMPRLIIGVFIQVLCSYSTLPLYAIVTQMGTTFKKSIFDEHIEAGLVGWAQKAKKKHGLKAAAAEASGSSGVQMASKS